MSFEYTQESCGSVLRAPESGKNAREDVGQDPVPQLFAGKVEDRRQADHHTGLQACHVLRSSGRESGAAGRA